MYTVFFLDLPSFLSRLVMSYHFTVKPLDITLVSLTLWERNVYKSDIASRHALVVIRRRYPLLCLGN